MGEISLPDSSWSQDSSDRGPFSWRFRIRSLLAAIGQSRWEAAGWLLMLALLAALSPLAVRRLTFDKGSDFPDFYAAGQHVLLHGARAPDSLLYYYLPSLDVAFAGLAWLPLEAAAIVYYVVQVTAWLGLLLAISQYVLPHWPTNQGRRAALAAGLTMLPLVLSQLCLGPFHLIMTYWLVVGLGRVGHGRWRTGGALLGLAIWIKVLPVLAAGYLLWKGNWRPALVAVLTALAIDATLCLAAYGPRTTIHEHHQWWREQVRGATHRIFSTAPALEQRTRNQSLAATMRRTFSSAPAFELHHGSLSHSAIPLSPEQLRLPYVLIQGCSGLWLAWALRQRWYTLRRVDLGRDIALVCLATAWFSPVVWSYHFIVATPALGLILWHWWAKRNIAITLLLSAWMLTEALYGVYWVRAYGVMLWMSGLVGVLAYHVAKPSSEPTSTLRGTASGKQIQPPVKRIAA